MRYTRYAIPLLRIAQPVLFSPIRKYHYRLLGLFGADIIAYWPLWEAPSAGGVITDLSGNGLHGSYGAGAAAPTLGEPGIGDGHTSARFDGTGDYGSLYSAGLAGALDGTEGTLAVWARATGASVWVDGVFRRAVHLIDDVNNVINIWKAAGANSLTFNYIAGGITSAVTINTTSTAWNHYALTWSLSSGASGEMLAYFNGAQVGETQTGLGTWVGPIVSAILGANNFTPSNVWDGWLAHAILLNRAATPAEIAQLAVV